MSRPPIQRWRIGYRRTGSAAATPARDAAAAWEEALIASGLALATDGAGRPRLQLGPPVAADMVAEEELLDVFLAERRPRADVRSALAAALPAGNEVLALDDVWVGAPSLTASVTGADYRLQIAPSADLTSPRLQAAIDAVLRSPSLPRERGRADRTSTYDLRALIDGLELTGDEQGLGLAMRLRIDPQLGTGRPADVLAALGEMGAMTVAPAGSIVRGRLYLSGG